MDDEKRDEDELGLPVDDFIPTPKTKRKKGGDDLEHDEVDGVDEEIENEDEKDTESLEDMIEDELDGDEDIFDDVEPEDRW